MGCASYQKPLKTQMPVNLTSECSKLSPVDSVKTVANLLEWAIEATNQYGECRLRHNALSEALK